MRRGSARAKTRAPDIGTGLASIDVLTRGFRPSDLVVLTGFAHSGKTQLVNTMISNNPNNIPKDGSGNPKYKVGDTAVYMPGVDYTAAQKAAVRYKIYGPASYRAISRIAWSHSP